LRKGLRDPTCIALRGPEPGHYRMVDLFLANQYVGQLVEALMG
jgi:hypothetical protein